MHRKPRNFLGFVVSDAFLAESVKLVE